MSFPLHSRLNDHLRYFVCFEPEGEDVMPKERGRGTRTNAPLVGQMHVLKRAMAAAPSVAISPSIRLSYLFPRALFYGSVNTNGISLLFRKNVPQDTEHFFGNC